MSKPFVVLLAHRAFVKNQHSFSQPYSFLGYRSDGTLYRKRTHELSPESTRTASTYLTSLQPLVFAAFFF